MDKRKSFKFNNGGRRESKRPKQKNDCSVRALSIAFKYDYDYCYDLLAKYGRKSFDGIVVKDFEKALREIIKTKKRKVIKRSFPKKKGQEPMTMKMFVQKYKKGRFIINQEDHFSTIVNGICNDIFRSWDEIVYDAWEIK